MTPRAAGAKGSKPSGARAPAPARPAPARRTPEPPTALPPEPPAGPLPLAVKVGLALTLVALMAHAFAYSFLTDDAFISFRYSRNLADGYGLVFNPGFERVEGYSNFLWVVILAALDKVGIPPERAANPLSLLATAGLWWVVVRFTLRHRPPASSPWLVLLPPAFLAASRSVAVWSTSGLETRAFELLATAGLLRLAEEVDDLRAGRRVAVPWGAILLGLGGLTRPDGALVAACALAAALALLLWMPRKMPAERAAAEPDPATPGASLAADAAPPASTAPPATRLREWAALAWPAVALIAAQYAFRLAYYGALQPNTYYAKVGGRLRPVAGLEYVGTFLLEYAAVLWVPGIVAAYLGLRRSSAKSWVLIATIALLPHVAYVVAIGGDHFEWRPLDLLFPFVALLLYEGARAITAHGRRRVAVAGGAALVLAGCFFLPWRSRVDFPKIYLPGFPGLQVSQGPVPQPDAAAADHFLDPDRSFVTRLPIVRQWAEAHRGALLDLTSFYGGIRAEEHRMFFALIHDQGRAIREVMDEGKIPRDIHFAMDCVGAIPYLTDARTLDRLGLTDAHVAHQEFGGDLIAHGKEATLDYARSQNVDVWFFHPAQLILSAASSSAMRAFEPPPAGEPGVFVAPLARDRWLIARFPRGEAAGRARLPQLAFWNMRDSSDVRAARAAAVRAWEAKLDSLPRDSEALDALGFLHAEAGDLRAAAGRYRELAEVTPADPDPLVNLAACLGPLGDREGMVAALRGAMARAAAQGDGDRARELEAEIARLVAGPPQP